MLNRIFPKQIDNAFRGHWLAILIFTLLVILRAAMGFNSITLTHMVATGADGIPLDSYGPACAAVVVLFFKNIGLFYLLLSLLGAVVLIRYRAMIPFMYLLLLIVQIGGTVLLLVHPVVRSGGMPIGVPINRAALAITLIGFVLSLVGKGRLRGQETEPA